MAVYEAVFVSKQTANKFIFPLILWCICGTEDIQKLMLGSTDLGQYLFKFVAVSSFSAARIDLSAYAW